MNGSGGSYIRQDDGSLKLVSRTEDKAPVTQRKPVAQGKKKENGNG